MKHRLIQYILILIVLTAIAGGYFYFKSNAAQKINASKVNNLTSGLVGYWTFDGADTTTTTVSDKNPTATKYNGTITSATPAIGKIGQALNFNGSSAKVNISGITAAINPPFSFGAWIKLNCNPAYEKRIITKSGSFTMYVNTNTIGCQDTNTDRGPLMTITWVPGQWYHIACVISASGEAMYINGSNSGSSDGWVPYDDGSSSLKIGTNGGGGGAFFDGQIDEVRYYNRALSQSEITELYQQGQTKINASQDGKLENGLAVYWTMDGADINWTNSTVADKSPVGTNTGTLTNMAQSTAPAIGKIGQAMNFDGAVTAGDYITASVTSLNGVTGLTVSAWLKADAFNSTQILRAGGSSTQHPWIAENGNGSISTTVKSGSAVTLTTDTNYLTTGQWMHMVVTWDGTGDRKIYAYKNGAQYDSSSSATSDGTTASNSQFYLATSAAADESFFDGSIDEFRVYTRALSTSEITELYQQGQTKINASQTNKLTSGLVVYYTMDGADTNWTSSTAGTVTDKSPIGTNTGTLTNMSQSTSPVIGKIGQAMYFDGSLDRIRKTSPSGLPEGNNPFTISTWVYFPTGAGSWGGGRGIVNFVKDPGGVYGNLFGIASYKLRHWFDSGSSLVANTALTNNAWHHAVVTYDGTNRRIYLNGSPDGNDTPPAQTLSGITDLYTGYYWANDTDISAKIDEVRIYNRALSQNEVTELYNQGR